jgi:acylphosphatase
MDFLKLSCVKIIVSGRVQGVGYRYFIARTADELELKGYAKNLFNGNVEITAEGRHEFLEVLIKKAKEGPRNSRVDSCKVEWLDFNKKYDKFEVL